MSAASSTTGRGSLVVELPEPVQVVDGRWLVAVWINARRPDTTAARAVPMYVPNLDQWVPSIDRSEAS